MNKSFQKSSWFFFLCFLISVAGLGFFLWLPDPKAEALYHQINAASESGENDYYLQQKRYGVVKEVLFNEGSELRKLRLECSEAEIVFTEKEGRGEVLERMYDVIGRLQEKLYYRLAEGKLLAGPFDLVVKSEEVMATPLQAVSYFEADSALYSFKKETLTAEQVLLTRYFLPTHAMPVVFIESVPEMTGSANQVSLSLKDRKFNLNAQGFKGRFDPTESIH